METSKVQVWAGVVLILVVGVIHLVDAPDSMTESALKGILFYANFVGGLVAAFGIWRGAGWGWILGLLVAGGAFIGYIVSRTAGIFGLPPDTWLEPLGILSLVVEALFIVLFARASTSRKR